MATWTVTCDECGQPFEAKRRDRRTCSDACRQRKRRRALRGALAASSPSPSTAIVPVQPTAPAAFRAPPMAPEAADRRPLSDLTRGTRESLARTADELDWQVRTVQAAIHASLVDEDGTVKTSGLGLLRDLEIVQGILVDKQAVALRLLRELESETGEDLEAAFTIIEVDAEGNRRVVSQPPELEELDRRERYVR